MIRTLRDIAPILVFALVGCSVSAPDPIPTFAESIVARLELMPQVAKYKWLRQLPIADPQREAELIAKIRERASVHGVPPDFAERFFLAQIEAAKQIQHEHFRQWERQPLIEEPIDLNDIRQTIDQLNDRLLVRIVPIQRGMEDPAWSHRCRIELDARLISAGYSDEVRRFALRWLPSQQD